MENTAIPVVFMPDNEPYLGRKLLFHFDQIIISAAQQNAVTAPTSHDRILTDHQNMACQVIAQSLSITFSIRELIRQGFLFGARVLLRPLVERAAILLYLYHYPNEIERWKKGWHQDAPGLAKMFDAIAKLQCDLKISGRDLTAAMNDVVHGKPDSARWNVITMGEIGYCHAVSKILNRPDLCDELCADAIPWLGVVQGMMAAYFPTEPEA